MTSSITPIPTTLLESKEPFGHRLMGYWKDFLDSLDTPGGHILILMLAFYMLKFLGGADAEKYRAECFGAILYSLRGIVKNGAK